MNSVPQPLHTLSLTTSAISALRRKGVLEIANLLHFTESEIANLNGVGRKALEVLQNELRRHNLFFREAE
jgi:DNA-directed RNA polymerase alpha subunit